MEDKRVALVDALSSRDHMETGSISKWAEWRHSCLCSWRFAVEVCALGVILIGLSYTLMPETLHCAFQCFPAKRTITISSANSKRNFPQTFKTFDCARQVRRERTVEAEKKNFKMNETPPNDMADLANVTRGPRRARQRLRFEPQQTPQRTTRAQQAAAQEEARRAALRSVGSGFTPEPQPSSTSRPVNPRRDQSSTMPRKSIRLFQIFLVS